MVMFFVLVSQALQNRHGLLPCRRGHHDGLELIDGDGDSQTLGVFTDFPLGTLLQPAGVTLANLDGLPGAEIIVTELGRFDIDGDGLDASALSRLYNWDTGQVMTEVTIDPSSRVEATGIFDSYFETIDPLVLGFVGIPGGPDHVPVAAS